MTIPALPPPRKNWWQRLNQKPPGWDEPAAFWGRMAQAVFLGLGYLAIRHWLHY